MGGNVAQWISGTEFQQIFRTPAESIFDFFRVDRQMILGRETIVGQHIHGKGSKPFGSVVVVFRFRDMFSWLTV